MIGGIADRKNTPELKKKKFLGLEIMEISGKTPGFYDLHNPPGGIESWAGMCSNFLRFSRKDTTL
jgi:hypothetical protein